MPDFANNYLPPGVYVEEDVSPLVSVVGTLPSVVAILGPSVGSRTHTEQVTLVGTTPVQLSKLGILSTGFKANKLDNTLIDGTEYALVVGPGEDADEDTLADNTMTIARVTGSDIADGATIFVTYNFADADYYRPNRFRDFDDVKDYYGTPIDASTGLIVSPVSLAASFAFSNGAREVMVVSTTGDADLTTRTELEAAYDSLATQQVANIVVPLPVGMTGSTATPGDIVTLAQNLSTKIDASASVDTMYRVMLIGYETTVSMEPTDISTGVVSRRVMLPWPVGLNYYNGFTNSVTEVAGYYLAAALGGLLAAGEVQESLTRKLVRGFTGIPGTKAALMTVSAKNTWAQGGVAVCEMDRNNNLVMRHGVTTDPSSVLTRELSIVRAQDAMVTLVHDTVERSGLIGSPIDDETPLRVKGVVSGCLETLVTAGTIIGYNNLKVRQQSLDPTVIEVKYAYRPSYPLNYIVISFSVDTTTGAVTVNA